MLIFDADNNPIILDNIHVPTLSDHLWVLDLSIMDFTLAPLLILEETVCPSLQVRINGFDFVLPASWNILVYDKDTSQLDVIEIAESAGKEFTSLVYGPKKSAIMPGVISIINYYPEFKNVGPSLNKHQMLCHPIGPGEWVCVSPSDTYNKYLKDCIVGDII